jgi:hypothetical protein
MIGVMNDIDEGASASSDVEQDKAAPGWNMDFGSQVAFWSGDTLVSCLCGAPRDTYCTCLPISLDFPLEGDHCHQVPVHQDQSNPTNSESAFSTVEPQVREDLRLAVPTRKEVDTPPNMATLCLG